MTKKYYRHKEAHRTVKGVKQKLCTKCIKWKGESEFRIDRATKDGLNIWCKDCSRDYERKLRRKDKKHVKKVLRYEETHRTVRGVKQKLCSCCKLWKKESLFHRHRRLKDGLQWRCKECESEYARERWEQIRGSGRRNLRYEDRHRVVDGVKQKLCRKCNRWKNESVFYKNRSEKDGLHDQCKKCSCRAAGKSYERKRKGVRKNLRYEDRHRVVKGIKQKFCHKCKRWENESDFYKNRATKDGLDSRCKTCSYKPTGKSRKKQRPKRPI